MAPKRPAPSPSSSALPSGTAFRTSAAKKRKGAPEIGSPSGSAKKVDSPKQQNSAAYKGKAKAKGKGKARPKEQSKDTKKATKEFPKLDSSSKSLVAKNAIQNGKKKASARFDVPSSKAASASKVKDKSQILVDSNVKPIRIAPLDSFRVVVGSYERLLYGFHITFEGQDELTPKFSTMFSFAAHTSCISALAAAGADSKWLATGAGDETVRVWDLKKRKEVGGLTGHSGTIHSLSFPARTYLLSADSSGLINLYRTRDWSLLKTLRGHTGKINACVAHPSGKLALSVGKDGMLRMWDLMRGKGAGAVRLDLGQEEGTKTTFKEEPLDVKWNESGSRFAVMGRTEVVVYKTDMSRVAGILVRRDDPKRKFGCVEWQGDDTLLTGNEMGVVEIYKLGKSTLEGPICKLVGHTNRVRDVRTIKLQLQSSVDLIVATTISSDGKIRLYNITSSVTSVDAQEKEIVVLQPFGTHDTGGARLTCLDVVGGSGGGAQIAANDAEEEEDGEEVEKDEEGELDQAEIEELYNLLDLVEEAKRQGVDIDGLSDFESGASLDEDDDDDVYDDSDSEGQEGEMEVEGDEQEEEEEGEEEED